MTIVRSKRYIGGYRVIAPVGAGGFATVYRAIDEEDGREVAIKVLAENHSLVSDTRRRFLAEIDLLRTVDSQAIAQVYEVGATESGQPYMVLELANRGDLRRRLEEIRGSHHVLNRTELALLAHHLYEALTTLHRAEIVHRDVSPGNILIRSHQGATTGVTRRGDGSVALLEPGERFLLADLGHAKDMIRASGFTAGGGTMGFTSPEQRDDITVVDLRADIFSATAVIEWAAHDGPFGNDLEPFFDIGLAEDPDDRFSSMTEWHGAFSAALSTSGNKKKRRFLPFTVRPAAETAQRRSAGAGRKVAAMAAAALALGGVVAILQSGFGRGPDPTTGQTGLPGATADTPGNLELETPDRIRSNELLEVGGTNSADQPSPGAGPAVLEVTPTDAESAELPDSVEGTTLVITTSSTESPTTQASTSTTENSGSASTNTTTVDGDDGPNSATETTTPTTSTETTNTSATDGVGGTEPSAKIDGESRREASASVDLLISGIATATVPEGQIYLMVWNTGTGQFWATETEQFESGIRQFIVEVEPNGDDTLTGTWEYTIPDEQLEPGLHFIRVWAEGPETNASDTHLVLIGP